jgi:hypothetical protein
MGGGGVDQFFGVFNTLFACFDWLWKAKVQFYRKLIPVNASPHLIHQFFLVILLVKVNKSYFVLKEKMSRHTRGGGMGSEKCHQMSQGGRGGGLKSVEKL